MSIYSNSNVIIEKVKDSYKLTIKNNHLFNEYYSYLSNSIGNIKQDKQVKGNREILFDCDSIEKLNKKNRELLTYIDYEKFFLWFGNMMNVLEKDKHCLLFIDIEDFMVININKNEKILLFLNSDKFLKLDDDKMEIESPFSKKNLFLSPELYKVDKIPTKIHKKSIFYSISVFITHCLNNINDITETNFEKQLESINNTKLYFALIRCLKVNVKNRFYLYI